MARLLVSTDLSTAEIAGSVGSMRQFLSASTAIESETYAGELGLGRLVL
jgi:hypothetical protein